METHPPFLKIQGYDSLSIFTKIYYNKIDIFGINMAECKKIINNIQEVLDII